MCRRCNIFFHSFFAGEKQDENRTERVNKKINTLDFSDDEGALTEGDGEEGNYEGDDELGNVRCSWYMGQLFFC